MVMVSRLLPAALVLAMLLFGCQQPKEEIGFSFTYLVTSQDGKSAESRFADSVSVPRNSAYFHIRANITNSGNTTHYLKVLDQEAGPYRTTLPLYARVRVNGIERDWRALDWAGTIGAGEVGKEGERLIPFAPGEERGLEAPVFFFNEKNVGASPAKTELLIEIVNASGSAIGEKTITVILTG